MKVGHFTVSPEQILQHPSRGCWQHGLRQWWRFASEAEPWHFQMLLAQIACVFLVTPTRYEDHQYGYFMVFHSSTKLGKVRMKLWNIMKPSWKPFNEPSTLGGWWFDIFRSSHIIPWLIVAISEFRRIQVLRDYCQRHGQGGLQGEGSLDETSSERLENELRDVEGGVNWT